MKNINQLNKDMEVIKGMLRVNDKALEDLKDNHLEYENPSKFRSKLLMLVKEKASLQCFYEKIEAEMRLAETDFDIIAQSIIDRTYGELKYVEEKLSRIPTDMLTAAQAIELHIVRTKLKNLAKLIMYKHKCEPIEEKTETEKNIMDECDVNEYLKIAPEIFTNPDIEYIVSPSGRKLVFINRGQIEAVQQYILSSKCNGNKISSMELEKIFVDNSELEKEDDTPVLTYDGKTMEVEKSDDVKTKEEVYQEIYHIIHSSAGSTKFIPLKTIKELIETITTNADILEEEDDDGIE